MRLGLLLATVCLFAWSLAAPIDQSQNGFSPEDQLLMTILQDYYSKMAGQKDNGEQHDLHLAELMRELLQYYQAEGIDPLNPYGEKRIVEDISNGFDQRYLDNNPSKRYLESIGNGLLPSKRYLESIGNGLLPSKRYLESIGNGLLPSKRYLESIGNGLLPSKRYLESIGNGLLPSKRYLESIGNGLLPSKRYLESIGNGLLPSKRYLESIGNGLLPSKRYLESIGNGILPSKRLSQTANDEKLPSHVTTLQQLKEYLAKLDSTKDGQDPEPESNENEQQASSGAQNDENKKILDIVNKLMKESPKTIR